MQVVMVLMCSIVLFAPELTTRVARLSAALLAWVMQSLAVPQKLVVVVVAVLQGPVVLLAVSVVGCGLRSGGRLPL